MVRVAPNAVVQTPARLVRSRARTFYFASLFLPGPMRRDVHEIYAYYRTVDDLVDDPPPGATRQGLLSQLDRWNAELHGENDDGSPYVSAVVRIALQYGAPVRYFAMVLDGARADLEARRIETVDDLVAYSVLVAGSVGMAMACILGASSPAALAAASDLGVAMQITNVLRDVGEDLDRGRIYIPRAEFASHGCALEALENRTVTPAFRQLMTDLIAVARLHYARGMRGIRFLPRRTQYSIYLAAVLYADILRKIERQDYDVFSRRAHLGLGEKCARAVPAYVGCRRVRN